MFYDGSHDEDPLVSVIVISCNSSDTILQTLDSIVQQTYKKIELIIADDGSNDDTLEKVDKWILNGNDNMKSIKVVANEVNTGISSNCNRGVKNSTGEYFKLIAADDILRSNCIIDLLNGIIEQSGDIAFCYEYVFYPEEEKYLFTEEEYRLEVRPSAIGIYKCSQLSMYKRLLAANQFPAPTSFIKKSIYDKLGGFDEKYEFMEDYPFWLKALKNDAKVVFVEIYGVYYRKNDMSISWRDKEVLTEAQQKFQKCMKTFIEEVRNPEMLRLGMEIKNPPKPDIRITRFSPQNNWDKKIFLLDEKLYKKGCNKFIRIFISIFSINFFVFKLKNMCKRMYTKFDKKLKSFINKYFVVKDRLYKKIKNYTYFKTSGLSRNILLPVLKYFDFKHEVPMLNDISSNRAYIKNLYSSYCWEKKYAKNKNDKKKLLFAVHLLSCFSALESIYLSAREENKLDTLLFLIPGRQPGMDNKWSYSEGMIEYMERKNYTYVLAYEDGKWKNILELYPDCVFFQTPYFAQRPALYNPIYYRHFPKIVYTPYGPWVMDRSVKDYIDTGIDVPFFNLLWKFFADKLTFELIEYAAPQYSEITVLSGTPKVDFHKLFNGGEYCWKNKSSRKKILWLPRWGVSEQRTAFIEYYQFFLDFVKENPNIDFAIRPHPLLFKDLARSKVISKSEITLIKSVFSEMPNSSIDYDCDYREGLLSCDFIVGDFSSILYEYLPTGKPIIYTRKDNTLIDPRIMQACYVVTTLEELTQQISLLLEGNDPLKQKREAVIRELMYFPNEEMLNGAYIAQYIADNL